MFDLDFVKLMGRESEADKMGAATKAYKKLLALDFEVVTPHATFDLALGLQACDRALLETVKIIRDALALESDEFSPPTAKVFPSTWVCKAAGCSFNTLISYGASSAKRYRWERYLGASHFLLFLEATSIRSEKFEKIRVAVGLLLGRVRSFQLELERQLVIPVYLKPKYVRPKKARMASWTTGFGGRNPGAIKSPPAEQCVMNFHEEIGAPDERIVGLQIQTPAPITDGPQIPRNANFLFAAAEDYGSEFTISLVVAGDLGRPGKVEFNLSYEHPVGFSDTRYVRGPRTNLQSTDVVFMDVDHDFNRRADVRVRALDLPPLGFLWVTPVINGRIYDKAAQAWPVKRGENPSLWEFIPMKPDC